MKVAIHGAGGRMGCRLVAVGFADPDVKIVGALESPKHPNFGKDAGVVAGIEPLGITLDQDLPESTEVVIDFATHDAFDSILERCLDQKVSLVIATTGLSESQGNKIRAAAETLPIVWAPSMSRTVNLTMKLAEKAAESLAKFGDQVDVEILERHHRFKADSPSGTALRFGELVAAKLNLDQTTHGREGMVGQRPKNELGYHAIRVGDNPGEHTLIFGLMGETIEMRVAASNRDCYASGAFAAAKFLADKPSGLFNMFDVLGL